MFYLVDSYHIYCQVIQLLKAQHPCLFQISPKRNAVLVPHARFFCLLFAFECFIPSAWPVLLLHFWDVDWCQCWWTNELHSLCGMLFHLLRVRVRIYAFMPLKLPSTSILIQQWTGLNPAILIINAIFNSYDWQSSGIGATVLLRFGLHISRLSDTGSSVTDCTFFKKRKERKSYSPVYGLLDSFFKFWMFVELGQGNLSSQGNKYSYFNYANQICYGCHKRDWLEVKYIFAIDGKLPYFVSCHRSFFCLHI